MSGHPDQRVDDSAGVGRQTDASMPAADLTDDAFLGGQLQILQYRHGYRAGLDAVLLAASVHDVDGLERRSVLDIGSGVGTVGLCIAHRLAKARVTLVDVQPELLDLANRNISRNGLEKRVTTVLADVTAKAATCRSAGLCVEAFQDVVMNPPYHPLAAGTPSPQKSKNLAHAMPSELLDDWIRFGVRVLEPAGRIFVIHKIAALPDLLAALSGRFGGIAVRPIQAFEGAEVSRVLVKATKGSRAPFRMLAPLVLHGATGENGRRAYVPGVDVVLRQGAALDDWP
ncbi:MAG: methyltransferase [Pseudomonadota bacterium]